MADFVGELGRVEVHELGTGVHTLVVRFVAREGLCRRANTRLLFLRKEKSDGYE